MGTPALRSYELEVTC